MDDSCAVCAETLEWVAYGSCGHREVCSTCVVRLRFVLDDRRCCLCKIESPTVFVTKALGDYTRVIADFSAFPSGANEGRVGQYWYHEDCQAYFDDVDHYKMSKAMCRLSCSVCDSGVGEQGGEAGKRRTQFRNIDQLKGHLFHRHKLLMCSLCLEGRKVFICEQKLYTRAQLNQHISTGNSEVDGSESERGGFMGHPMCEFCKDPFYGDNELYMHMSREHYTCHICQRQHPGQYDYFRNYDDLEIHFRQEHYICEDEACIAKKFIVFQSESEFKRHNAIEHGGHMSRSKRNSVLQIPTSFTYRRSSPLEQRRGRGHGFLSDSSSSQLAMAIQASLETEYMSSRARGPSSSGAIDCRHGETSQVGTLAGSFESINVTPDSSLPSRSQAGARNTSILEESSFPALSDREPPAPSSRYSQTLGSSNGEGLLGEESFPPLPGASGKSSMGPKQFGKIFARQTAKDRLRSKAVPKITQAWSVGNHGPCPTIPGSSSQTKPAPFLEPAPSSSTSSFPSMAKANLGTSPFNSANTQSKPSTSNGFTLPNSVNSLLLTLNKTNSLNLSSSAPNLQKGPLISAPSSSTCPMLNEKGEPPTSGQSLHNMENVRTANKYLVEKIRAGLGMDEDKFAAFKIISAEYRQGLIGTVEYLSYVEQSGLSHLVIELARLCPDPQKQHELVDTYYTNLQSKNPRETNSIVSHSKQSDVSSKKKGKSLDCLHSNSKDALADSILNTVKKLQANSKPSEEEGEELLSKDGYRTARDRLTLPARAEHNDRSSVDSMSQSNGTCSVQNVGGGTGKQSRKTSKFHRVRLGDGSSESVLDFGRANISSERTEENISSNQAEGLPIQGVWRNSGGQKLFATSTRKKSR